MKIFVSNGQNAKENQDECVLDGYTIHESWRTAWPKAIARAWYIEKQLNWKDDDYNRLAMVIDDAMNSNVKPKKTIGDLIDVLNTETKKLSSIQISEEFKNQKKKEYDELLIKINKIKKEHNYTDKTFLCDCLEYLPTGDMKLLFKKILESYNDFPGSESVDKKHLEWFKKLLSHNSEMVLEALMEEGFITDAMENIPIGFEKDLSARLIVRKYNQNYLVKQKLIKAEYTGGIQNVITNQNEKLSTYHYLENNSIEHKYEIQMNSRQNGWNGVHGLKHVLVLTLPPAPEDPAIHALAITDYEADGKVYPFTLC